MATIRNVRAPLLPFHRENGLSGQSHPYISDKLHAFIRSETARLWHQRLSRITQKSLMRATKDSAVVITTTGRILANLVVLSLTEERAEVKLYFPLRGTEAEIEEVLGKIFPSTPNSSFYAENGGIKAKLLLYPKAVPVKVRVTGADRVITKFVTTEEFATFGHEAVSWLPDLTGSVR